MFENFNHPQELYQYQLGAAMTMEQDSLDMLEELERTVRSDEVRDLLVHHQQETKDQIQNLTQVFELLGSDVETSPSATTRGLMKEGRSLLGKTEPNLADYVVLNAALGTEHYEIASYQMLIVGAGDARDGQIRSLLQQNLAQEEAASEKLLAAAQHLIAPR